MDYPKELESLPIYEHMDSICDALKTSPSHFLVLSADTGAGKSTAIPFALLKNFSGKILMLEPRRLAVLNIANRVSRLLNENVGETCGYQMHLENRTSDKSRFIVLTEAILTRKIQNDPSLVGVSVVVLDEFHERSIHADLALAFLKEIMTIREDLYVIVMSATIDTKKISTYLGGVENCPSYSVAGKLYPVEILFKTDQSVTKAILENLGTDETGTILAFLPGLSEILRVQNELLSANCDADVDILHSSVPVNKQKQILSPSKSNQRKVILSSAIAETSVTVPDVSVVIDSGLSRMTEFNQNILMEHLVTRRVSVFSANQRAGRAGRTRPGKCIRLWNQNEVLSQSSVPEILRTDLSQTVLECAEWGSMDINSLDWLDSPSKGSWEGAKDVLTMLGCIADGKITNLGKSCLLLGVNPRVACVALSGAMTGDFDFSTRLAVQLLHTGQSNQQMVDLYVENLKKRVQIACGKHDLSTSFPQPAEKLSTGYALLCGYPDRLAVQEEINSNKYQFPSGRYATIVQEKGTVFSKYIVAPDVDGGNVVGKIRMYENLSPDLAEKFMNNRSESKIFVDLDGQNQIKKEELVCYGKIVLKRTKLKISGEDYLHAICSKVKREGLECLPLNENCHDFLKRVQFYIKYGAKEKVDDLNLVAKLENLSDEAEDWLAPFLPPKQKVSEEIVFSALKYYLAGDEINKKVPRELILPNGKKRRVIYENQSEEIVPVMEIIIQHLFGCFETPKILGVPILFKLLSPARRPLQITRDLENFWNNTWPEICSEMKGRYPKHNWDYRTVVSDN